VQPVNAKRFWQIVAVMAELERGLMLERTRAGLAAARAGVFHDLSCARDAI
jgi:hypothetical protein